jgi:hypothetical protein
VANTLLTIDMITREAVRLFRNSNAFVMSIDRQYDDQYARIGAKIGTQLRIRMPNDYVVRHGAAASVQDTSEQSIVLALATQAGVDVSFSSADRTMSLDDYSQRVLAPAVNNVAADVAYTIMAGVDNTAGCCNFVAKFDNNGAIISPTASEWLLASAVLKNNSTPLSDWKIVLDPITEARTVSSLSGLFNPAPEISRQYRSGTMYDALGFRWMGDQTVVKHTTGAYTGTGSPATIAGTVNGGGQTGTAITVNALGPLAAGDIITFDGVNQVNRLNKQSVGVLRQFVVVNPVPAGGLSITVYPALIPNAYTAAQIAAGAVYTPVQYQTVDFSPINAANIHVVTLSGSIYRKNLAFAPEAITMATADLEMPRGVDEVARETFDSISMRMLTDYVVTTDQLITRLDVIYGFKFVRPEWVVAVADAP